MPAPASSSIDLNPHDFQEVLRVLNLYLPTVEVRAFGSRAKWTAKPYSDLDLALMTDRPLSLAQEAQLREAFDETTIPFKVDFVDWAATSETFRKIIDNNSVVIRPASQTPAGDWAVFTLDEALEALLDYRGKTPQKTTTGIPLITAKIVKNGRIESPTEFIASQDYAAWMTRGLPKAGDVVLTTEAPLGEVAQLNAAQVALAQRIVVLRGKSGVLDNTYLRYLLQTAEMQEQLAARATGTTVLDIKQSELRKIAMRLPPIAQQLAAVRTLSGLDDKIELNRRMNETLEAMAQAIFQSWFVDFDPVRAKASGEPVESICNRLGLTPELLAVFPHELVDAELGTTPAQWAVMPLGEVTAYLSRGLSPKYVEEGGVCVLNQKCIRDGRVSTASARRHDHGQRSVAGRELALEDILVNSTGTGTLGRVAQVLALEETTVVDSHVTVVRADVKVCTPSYLSFVLMTRQSEIEALGEGSTGQTELSRARLAAFKVLVPPLRLMAKFDATVRALREASVQGERQNTCLARTRDTLLPKLLSGDLRAHAIQA